MLQCKRLRQTSMTEQSTDQAAPANGATQTFTKANSLRP